MEEDRVPTVSLDPAKTLHALGQAIEQADLLIGGEGQIQGRFAPPKLASAWLQDHPVEAATHLIETRLGQRIRQHEAGLLLFRDSKQPVDVQQESFRDSLLGTASKCLVEHGAHQ